ncbi:hypothetical protein QN277_024743 [Acacia crassicarpa]|uniref:Uncharacterized protein n=1 Tax=Acacia crassicarpa TaxID=499986 RepID=A0AAE1JEG3_9FABA|nr:hypothetical protein QN277_024743 [Acacia crassicarpa]
MTRAATLFWVKPKPTLLRIFFPHFLGETEREANHSIQGDLSKQEETQFRFSAKISLLLNLQLQEQEQQGSH